jgi:stearoyl-CoA desaturase (delta-9 desaturase)
MLAINLLLFGWVGLIIWGIQMIWIPFWAAGVINGIGHWWGYRNGETKDHSKNIIPIGILIGGEEMHNNHHLDPANPKFSRRWFEFDVSWLYIRILCALRLAKLR